MGVGERILARLAEVEAVALAAIHDSYGVGEWAGDQGIATDAHIALNDPAHVLRWVAALRAVVELHMSCDDVSYGDDSTCPELALIAAIWGDAGDGAGGEL